MSRYMHLSIYDEDRIDRIMAAMSSKIRRDMLRLLNCGTYSISEIAQIMNLPISSASFHINQLIEADLVHVQSQSLQHKSFKIISRKLDEINICYLANFGSNQVLTRVLDVPIGGFSDCDVMPSCGMANEEYIIEMDDNPGVFFSPAKTNAQIIWFSSGYLEYKIPNYFLKDKELVGLSISFEICSEAPNYRNDWESDITFWINGSEVGTWTSPGDFGGNRGQLNPPWWPDSSSQYGLLKTLRVNSRGSFLDENMLSAIKIEDLHIEEGNYFTFRIGVKPDAVNVGGINLFGEKYGNYQQNIIMKFSYKDK